MKKLSIKLACPIVFAVLATGCGGNESNTQSNVVTSDIGELPTVTAKKAIQQKSAVSELDTIRASVNDLSWAYYQDKTKSKWYISTTALNYVLSLKPIVNGDAGWGGISTSAGKINIDNDTITIGNIPTKSDCRYYDYGIKQYQTDCVINNDIALISNSTVDIKWWFFKAANDTWYIINDTGYILRFGSDTSGEYDWELIGSNTNPVFYVENGKKKLKFSSTPEAPFVLNSPDDATKNIHKTDCTFTDVNKNDWFYPYVTSLCQAGVIQGYADSNYQEYRPANPAQWQEVAKIANLSWDYEKVTNDCTSSAYDNAAWYECYLDKADSIGFSRGVGDVTRGYAIQYVVKLFYNKDLTQYEAGQFLLKRGIINGEGGNGIIDSGYLNTILNRAEISKIVLNIAGIRNIELPNVASALPYGIIPPSVETPLVDIELPSVSTKGIAITTDASCAQDPDKVLNDQCDYEGFVRKSIVPEKMIEEADATKVDSLDLPQVVVEKAKSNIGKTGPYVDSKNTNDMLFVNTMLDLPTVHATPQDMVDHYKAEGKTKPVSEAKDGDILVYKPSASTDSQPHMAIKDGLEEISLPNVSGIQKTDTKEELLDVVIPLESLDLPTVGKAVKVKDLHANDYGTPTYITGSGDVPGYMHKGDVDYFQVPLKAGERLIVNYSGVLPCNLRIKDSARKILKESIVSGTSQIEFDVTEDGMYFISLNTQGNSSESADYILNFSCGQKGISCSSLNENGGSTSEGNTLEDAIPLNINQTISAEINVKGDVDFYEFEVTKSSYASVTINASPTSASYPYSRMAIKIYNSEGGGNFYPSYSGSSARIILDKGRYYLAIRSSNNIDLTSYTLQVTY